MIDAIFDCETTGLDMNKDRIICICVNNVEMKEKKTFMGEEKTILEDFWGYVRKFECVRLIGFCSESFDIPFLIRRSLMHAVRIAKFQSIDLRKISNGFFYSYSKFQKGDLEFWAGVFNIPIRTDGGEMMLKLFVERKFKEIEEHCLEDINITSHLYERCKHCNLIIGKGVKDGID